MSQNRSIIVLGASLTQFGVIGVFFAYGVFFKEFETEFGWSRTFLSACGAVATFMMGFLALVGGRLIDRFGPRRVLMTSGMLYGLGFLLISQIDARWQLFVICGTLVAAGLGTHDVGTLGTIARWFEKKRGIMSGVVKLGTAVGQMVMPPVSAMLILAIGWRMTSASLGLAAAVLLVLAALMLRNPPVAKGSTAQGSSARIAFAEARRGRIFWTLCLIQFLFFPALMSLPLHLAVHGMDLGMEQAVAAGLLSVVGAASAGGRLVVGLFFDRIGGKSAYVLCFVILIASLMAFAATSSHGLLFVVAGFYGFAHGGFFTVVSPSVASYFGMRAHGAIFGSILFAGTIGGAIGPILTGYAFDITGSYQIAFLSLTALAAIGLALVLSLPNAVAAKSTPSRA